MSESSSPLISIVLPTYNGARYLEQAIRSCLEQTYENLELIIVDDASTDETPEIIAKYASKDPRVISIRNSGNRQLPASLNIGFARARGEWLTWTSDDNVYRPTALAEMSSVLQAQKADIVCADVTVIDENNVQLEEWSTGGREELLDRNCVGACFLYRRSVQEQLSGYSEDLFLVEDYDFWLRASIVFEIVPIHKSLYLFRRHAGALTHIHAEPRRRAIAKVLRKNLPRMKWLSSRQRAERFLSMAQQARWRNWPAETWGCIFDALLSDPFFVAATWIRGKG